MMVTEGRGRVNGREQLRDIRQDRLSLEGFELVHDGCTWSWKMTRERFQYWRERIHAVAAKRPGARAVGHDSAGPFDADIEKIMDALYNSPGFRLTRRQVGELVKFARAEWRRLRPNDGIGIRRRNFLPYIQRLPNCKSPREEGRPS
jgi:hypothetical protein